MSKFEVLKIVGMVFFAALDIAIAIVLINIAYEWWATA